MENLTKIVVELKKEESLEVTGGSFGYDVGWAIYWTVQLVGNPVMSSANMFLAGAAYDAHYK
jgi:hypothetical protein